MTGHDAHALVKERFRRQFAGVKIMARVAKNPGIVKGAAPDAHARATGFIKHHFGRLRRGDVTIPDDRNGLDGLNNGANSLKVHRSAEPLLSRPSMHKNRGRPGVFQHARQIRRG